MTSPPEPFETFDSALKSCATWKCRVICKGVSNSSKDAVDVDICTLMIDGIGLNPVHPQSKFKFDPILFSGVSNETCQKIQKHVIAACRLSGFFLMATSKSKRSIHGRRLAMLDFACEHNRSPRSKSPGKRNSFAPAPRSEESRCRFGFKIFCCKEDNFWYLSTNKDTDLNNAGVHTGHHALPAATIRTTISEADEKTIQLALHAEQLAIPNALISKLVNLQGNGTLKFCPKQIAYLVSRHKAEKIVHNFKGHYQSSAEKLIAAFDLMIEQNDDIVYVAMIHSKDDEYLLKTSKGRPQKVSKQTDLNIEEVRKSMSINDNQSVLLAFAWITGDELRMLERFPELITFDVTEKTNNEKRGLFVGVGQDGNGKLFIGLHCFMPNAQLVSYNWIYEHAIPELWTEEILRCNEVVLTDGEVNLYSPIANLSETTCGWNGSQLYR